MILAVVNTYALSRGLICGAGPGGAFGLFRFRAETAAYIEIWARRIVTVGVSGVAFANAALLLGLHRAGYAAALRLVMLIVHLFVVIIILQCRRQVAGRSARRPAARARLQGYAIARRGLALSCDRPGPLTMGGVGAEYPQWLSLLLSILSAPSPSCDHARGQHRGAEPHRSRLKIGPDVLQRFPGLETRANRYLPLLR